MTKIANGQLVRALLSEPAFTSDTRNFKKPVLVPLIGDAEGLRCSEIVNLDVHRDNTSNSGGWIEALKDGALLTLDAKTG